MRVFDPFSALGPDDLGVGPERGQAHPGDVFVHQPIPGAGGGLGGVPHALAGSVERPVFHDRPGQRGLAGLARDGQVHR